MFQGFGGLGEVGRVLFAHRLVEHGDLDGDVVAGAVQELTAGGEQRLGFGQDGFEFRLQRAADMVEFLKVLRGAAFGLGDVAEGEALLAAVGQGERLEPQALLVGGLAGQPFAQRDRLRLAGGLVGGGQAAFLEFGERGEGGGMVVEFDQAGSLGEAVARFLFLRLQEVPVDDAGDQQEEAADPGRRHHHVAAVEPGARVLAQGAGFAEEAFGQAVFLRGRALQPGGEADDEDGRRGAAGGFLLEGLPLVIEAFQRRALRGLGFGTGGEFAGPGFEPGDLRDRIFREGELMVAFERADASEGRGAGLPVAAGARFRGLGDEAGDLFGGLGAQPGDATGKGVVPARFAGEVVGAEAFHPVHQLDGFFGAPFGEERRHLAERLTEELGGEAGEFGAGVRVVRIDADNRAQDGEGAIFLAAADGVAVVAVKRMALADLAAVEAFDGEDVLAVEREPGGQAAFAAQRVPAVGFGEAEHRAQPEEVGVGFG